MAGSALTKVEAQIEVLKGWGETSMSAAENALTTLSQINFPTSYPTQYTANSLSTFSPSAGSLPGDLIIDTPPDVVSMTIPTKPDRPDIPTVTLGELHVLTLPDVPTVSFPSLDITAPVYSFVSPKEWSFEVNSNILITDDPLIQAVIDRLTDNIKNGGTGLSADIEASIWARELERDEQQLEDSTDKIIQMWAKKGFSLPDGMLANSLSDVQKEYMNRKIDRSREIAIKQADLEQSNLFKSLEMAITLADKLINMLIRYEELVFKGQEATARYANEYIDLQIKTYMSKVEAYKATAQVHEMIIRAEMAKVEIYKAQLEGQRLIGEINTQTIRVYSEQLQATTILIERYKTEVQAMVSELEIEKVKIETNKLQFDIWAKDVDVQIAKYNGEIEFYKADSLINVSTAELQGKQAEAQTRMFLSAAELSIKSYEISEKSMNLKSSIIMEAAKGVAIATASLAAGAMAALGAHTSMSYDESMTLEEA